MARKPRPDNLPGRYLTRVFIGGSYDVLDRLRDIKHAVESVGLKGIIAREFGVDPAEIHDWDIRLLHNCKHAIFYLGTPAGELMEIERTRDYKCKTLLLYGMKGEDTPAPEHITKMARTMGLPLRGIRDTSHLRKVVEQFLRPQQVSFLPSHTWAFRYIYEKVTSTLSFQRDGRTTRTYEYKRLRAVSNQPVKEVPFRAWTDTGSVRSIKVQTSSGPQKVEWQEKNTERRGTRVIGRKGVIRFVPPLQANQHRSVSYTIRVEFDRAFALTAEEFLHSHPGEEPLESSSLQVVSPIAELTLELRAFAGYPLLPEFMVQYGTYVEPDLLLNPQYDFEIYPNRVKWKVLQPKILHSYILRWELMTRAEFQKKFS